MKTRTSTLALSALLFALTIVGCGGGGETPANNDASPMVLRANIQSSQTGMTYGYYIYLPPHYATTQTTYLVIYATDSEYRFDPLSAALQDTRTEAILINIVVQPKAAARITASTRSSRTDMVYLMD